MNFLQMIEILNDTDNKYSSDYQWEVAQDLAWNIHPTGNPTDRMVDWLWDRGYNGNETEDSLWAEWDTIHNKPIKTVHLP